MDSLPPFNITHPEKLTADERQQIVDFMHQTGILIAKDDTVTFEDNESFVDLMEAYFSQSYEQKMKDARPELFHQVGVTPEGIEISTCAQDPECVAETQRLPEENRPAHHQQPDPKWRYMWRIGSRPDSTEYAELNADDIVPDAFAGEWADTMNNWGYKLLNVINKVTRVLDATLDLRSPLSALLEGGSNLLAPTGTDLSMYGEKGVVFAGYHHDISFLTIHGKSRFPGLNVWLRDGRKIPVKIPDGSLLLQVGHQLEWLTGGYFLAGKHEVVCTEKTSEAIARAKNEGRPLWRVSSTLFSHINTECYLEPLLVNLSSGVSREYPKIKQGDYMNIELAKINLKTKN
jgi:isopenicillin N synthase-like dioxygenase